MYYPNFAEFEKLSKEGNLIPLYREILADLETPVSVLMKLRGKPYAFLLESVEGGEKWGRFTFLGSDPRVVFKIRGGEVIIETNGTVSRYEHGGDPLNHLRQLVRSYRPVAVEGCPRFYGGAVGYFGYDTVGYFEKLPAHARDDLRTEEAIFLITDTMIIFDNVRHTLKVVSCAHTGAGRDLRGIYDASTQKIEEMIDLINAPVAAPVVEKEVNAVQPDREQASFASNMSQEYFTDMVKKAKDYILAGDIIQVVLSQRFNMPNPVDQIDLYRALRYVNPSPYLFFLKLEDMTLIGSSPEVMVRLEEKTMELRPIAGTRRRGRTEQEDRQLADELLADPKERAEHVMLVDLGRNDLGRIAHIGSVQVTQLMAVERYSHVMHLVSNIQAQLAEGRDAFDVLTATFPAGTLSGAPKIRAMEIIDELEPTRRGPYGGAVGYFSFSGNMDFCITIRTIMLKGENLFIQAGAGIVADSNPLTEYHETMNKAAGMKEAIRLAAGGFIIT